MNEEDIFSAAIEMSTEDERAAFLDRVCGDDADLRRQVGDLLYAHDHPDTFLEAPLGVAATTVRPITEKPGDTIGPYTLVEPIGQGGMGVVYRAKQTEPIKRSVALKVIKPGMDTQAVIGRFEAERQTLALMDHPNIAHVLDAGTTESGRPYFVMELVRGIPITDYCDGCAYSTRDRLELFVQVCQAINHAHERGIIHRDVKPSNVLIEMRDGEPAPKVIDFGVAKAMGRQLTEHTLTTGFAQMLGTPLYMSPEQAEMSPVDVDVRSDVYSLGVLLYQLLTGTTPFDEERLRTSNFDELRRIIREEEPPKPSTRLSTLGDQAATIAENRRTQPHRLQRQLRGDLDWIAMKALEKDPRHRYPFANALAADVQRYLADRPTLARPPSLTGRAIKWSRRHMALVMSTAIILLVTTILASLSGAMLWSERSGTLAALDGESQQRRSAEEQEQRARRSEAEALRERDRALQNQYHAEIVSGQADWERGNIGSLHRKLVGHLPVNGEEDRRGWEWYFLFSQCHPEERTMFHRGLRPFASWSPDGEYVAIAGTIWSARSGECVREFSSSHIIRARVAWSPDGQQCAWGIAADDNRIFIWDRSTDAVRSLRGHESSVGCVGWSPDGAQLVSGSLDKTVRIWDVTRGITVRTLPVDHHVTGVAWSPDGELLAAGVQGLKIWKLSTGELVTDREEAGRLVRVSWHPDGGQLAVSKDESWYVLDATDWTVTREQKHTTGSGRDIAWNPRGTRLAVAHGEVVTIWDRDGEQPLATLRGHLRPVNSVAWSPDGTRLMTSDNVEEIKVWDWNAPVEPPPIPTDGPLESLAWLADGQTLVTVSAEDHSASFWDATQGNRIKVEQPQVESPVLWSPDRRLWAIRAGTDEKPEVHILDASTGAVHSVWQGPAQHRLHDIDWSPDATTLAIETSFDGYVDLVFWDVDREQTISHWQKEQHHYQDTLGRIQWSDDGARVAIIAQGDVGDDGSVAHKPHAHIVDVATGKRLQKHNLGGHGHSGAVKALAWSPGGDLLACGGSQGGVQVLDAESGRVLVSSKPHNSQIDGLTWSPDGLRLASASRDRSVKVLGANDGAELLTFPFDEDSPTRLAWSADGHRLAGSTKSGTIHVWDAGWGYQFSEQGQRRGELAWAYYRRTLPSGVGVDRPALREFLRLVPDTLEFWEARGHANATLREFDAAAQEFAKAIGPDIQLSYQPANHRAFALLGAGDLEVYRDACASLVENFSDSDVPSNRVFVAWLCVLSPKPPADSTTVLQMARAIHKHKSSDDYQNLQLLIIGASLFRDSQFDEAVGMLTALADKLGRGGDATDRYELACAEYFVALARHQQGHDFQARRHLAEAIRHADAYQQVGQDWNALVALAVLQRETEAALSQP